MQEFLMVTGMVIYTAPVDEYDRRVVLLTKERGKISAFAKGVRRVNSSVPAAIDTFAFGQFKLFVGKHSYRIVECNITNYFEELKMDLEGACFGMYFMELANYYTREESDEQEVLKLMYQSLRAIGSEKFENRLVRCVYELKLIMLNGEFVPIDESAYHQTTLYTVRFLMDTEPAKIYTFSVKDDILLELEKIAQWEISKCIDRPMKSLAVLEGMLGNI